MASSLDELDNVQNFAEEIFDLNKQASNVGAHPRESFLLVRKPTQRRLSKHPDHSQSKCFTEALSPIQPFAEATSMVALHPEIRLGTTETLNVKSYQSSHEDEIKSSVSLTTEKAIGLFPSDRDMKSSIFAVNRGSRSRFRISHFQQIEKIAPSRSSVPSSNKLDEQSLNLSVTNRGPPSQIAKRITESFFSRTRLSTQERKSVRFTTKYLKAINDKCEFFEDEITYHHETTDRRLRGLLKKHAIKRRRTLEMKDIVKKLKQQQSRTWISSNKTLNHF